MSLGYITIPRGEYESLLREVRRGAEVCQEIGVLRLVLQAFAGDMRMPRGVIADLRKGAEACDEVSRLRVELEALGRRLR